VVGGRIIVMNRKGFTLIELLIVVAIIGILAAVGAAVIPGLLEKTKITATKENHAVVVNYFKTTITLCSTGQNIVPYTSYPQCKKIDSACSAQTDVAWYHASFAQMFRCEIKNAFDSKEGFTYSVPQMAANAIPSKVGRMHISTEWPKANTITFHTRWGEGTNEVLSSTYKAD
jgi:prepilin-type N-terminal cleavage/methylation domain-containing protein